MTDVLVLLWEQRDEILAGIAAILIAATALVRAIQAASHAASDWAASIPGDQGDEALKRFADAVDRVSSKLEDLVAWVPRIAVGKRGPK